MPESKTTLRSANDLLYARQDTKTGNYNVYLKRNPLKIALIDPVNGNIKTLATGVWLKRAEINDLKLMADGLKM